MTALGVLYNPLLPQGSLLDAIKFSETGHLSDDKARTAVSRAGAVGPYQFMQKFLPDFGYGMPKNIPWLTYRTPKITTAGRQVRHWLLGLPQLRDTTRKAGRLQRWPNCGQWKAAGANIADLPAETQKYIQKAAAYLTTRNR